MALQADDLQRMLETKMDTFLKSDEFKDTLTASIREAIGDVIQAAVTPFKEAIDKFDERVQEAIATEITPLKEVIKHLHRKLDEVQSKANENEQYSRRNNIRIHGINQTDDEDCYEEVINFCDRELNIAIDRSEIDRAHRVGRPNNDARSRPIIVKLKSFHTKLNIMKNKRKLRGKPLYVNEDLTKANQQLLMYARKECRVTGLVYTTDGYIFVKRKSDNKIFRIKKEEDLTTLNLR